MWLWALALTTKESTIHTYPEGIPRALSGEVGLLALPEKPSVHEKPSLAPLHRNRTLLIKKIFLKIRTKFHVIFSWKRENVVFTWLAVCVCFYMHYLHCLNPTSHRATLLCCRTM